MQELEWRAQIELCIRCLRRTLPEVEDSPVESFIEVLD